MADLTINQYPARPLASILPSDNFLTQAAASVTEPFQTVSNSNLLKSYTNYLDVYTNQASVALQATSTTATPFILPSHIVGLSVGTSLAYDGATGRITVNKEGLYLFRFMFQFNATSNTTVEYKAATFDALGAATAIATSGRRHEVRTGTITQIVFDSANYWNAGTRIGIYITITNAGHGTLVTSPVSSIGAQPVSAMAARFQLSGIAS